MDLEVLAVVVAYNSEAVIEGLLDSIPAAMGSCRYAVVVVDNDSTDRTREIVGAAPDVALVHQPNNGYSAGVNAGVAHGPRAESILVLNPDTRLSPRSVERMLRRLRTTSAGIVAPRTTDENGQTAWTLRREPSLLRASGLSFTGRPIFSEYVQEPDEYATSHVVCWAVGSTLLVSWECHEAVGGWDESYFLYSEETDFCLRARDLGWLTFYEAEAAVVHIGGASGRSGHTHAMQILNRVRLYARRHSRPAAYAYYGLTVLSECSWVLRGNEKTKSSLHALVHPSDRPKELGLRDQLLPL